MIPYRTLAIPALIVLATTACTGLGRAPALVDLYDQALPTGIIEMEIDRDGTFRELEADIPVEALPAIAREAALARLPGAEIFGAERELRNDGPGWEVKLRHEGRLWEVVIDEKGAVVETEKELTREEAPAVILKAADQTIPGCSFMSVELIERGEHQEYHVKQAREGSNFKIVLAPDGTVIRKVREQRAEIEIPLKS